MSKIKTAYGVSGILQCIRPTRNPDGAPLAVTAVSASSANMIGSEAVAFYSTTDVHVYFSSNAVDAATVNDYIIPAGTERVLHCEMDEYLHARRTATSADGTLNWWPAAIIS